MSRPLTTLILKTHAEVLFDEWSHRAQAARGGRKSDPLDRPPGRVVFPHGGILVDPRVATSVDGAPDRGQLVKRPHQNVGGRGEYNTIHYITIGTAYSALFDNTIQS